MNKNDQRLLALTCYHSLCVTNTFFRCKDIHQVSWRHPRSGHWHQLDLVITRRADVGNVLLTRSFHSADCDTDHALVVSKVRLTPKKLHHSKKKCRPRVNTCCTSNSERTHQFTRKLEEALGSEGTIDTIDTKWSHLRDALYDAAIHAYGKKERKNADWYEAHWEEMEPLVEEKRKALLAYKTKPSPSTLHALRSARNKAQQTARHCANTYWLNLCSSIQSAADTGNIRGMY